MKRTLMTVLLALAVVPNARAAGYGAYFEYANVFDGKFTNGCDGCDFNGDSDIDYEEDHYGVGFTFDTAVAMDKLFNYRLSVGYEHVSADYKVKIDGAKFSSDEDGDGIAVDSAFGFGLVRNSRMRLWIGPAVRLSTDFFTPSGYSDYFDFAIGAGPEIGLNFHVNDRISLGMTAGYQILYSLSVTDDNSSYCDGHGHCYDYDYDSIDGYEQMAFIKLVMLFRTADDIF
ncbi:MAG TPA: hypothetical protein VN634_01580 [Candidatus Limnocylindrales bacterium]|nr:hypothetical protein [Candidatus Limnocylindrales bacterium]